MARINELTDQQAAAFGHAFLRWVTDEDPAQVAHFFPELDPHRVDDSEAANMSRSILEDLIAERFLKHMPVHTAPTLSKLSDRGQTIANPDDDIRGRKVKDKDGRDVGRVDDLLIDDQDRKVRFLRVEHGGLLGFGETKSFIPVDAITRITADDVFIDHSREHVMGAPRYDPELVDPLPYYGSLYGHYGYLPFWGMGYMALA
jgi:sporulation protein YlmC with PRC-barrel domain